MDVHIIRFYLWYGKIMIKSYRTVRLISLALKGLIFREREHFLEIFKIQVDDIILPWVADGVPMY